MAEDVVVNVEEHNMAFTYLMLLAKTQTSIIATCLS
jgi:hypothetical protein